MYVSLRQPAQIRTTVYESPLVQEFFGSPTLHHHTWADIVLAVKPGQLPVASTPWHLLCMVQHSA